MRKLIRSFERSGVEYLLISGQASILYGAATFSEDIDIRLRLARSNVVRILKDMVANCAQLVAGHEKEMTPQVGSYRLPKEDQYGLPRCAWEELM